MGLVPLLATSCRRLPLVEPPEEEVFLHLILGPDSINVSPVRAADKAICRPGECLRFGGSIAEIGRECASQRAGASPLKKENSRMKNRSVHTLVVLLAALAITFAFALASDAFAQTENILYNFNTNTKGTDGEDPYLYGALIMDADGNLYGTAANGGKTHGVVYELTPKADGKDPWKIKILHSFKGYDSSDPKKSDGDFPWSGLIMDSSGNLYGVTGEGGTSNNGTVYRLSPNGKGGWKETILHNFAGGTDGTDPSYPLTMDSQGNLYGTTSAGGNGEYCAGEGCGIVFELSPTESGPWTETIIHAFQGFSQTLCDEGQPGDGNGPVGQLYLAPSGNMFGPTSEGGCYNPGTVYELTPNGSGGWNYGQIFVFPSAGNGATPEGGLTGDAEGNLYGTWSTGVYELQASGAYEVLYYTCNGCPGSPTDFVGGTPIFDSSGNLYATSYGTVDGAYGTVFELSPTASGLWNEQTLWSFDHTDGSNPECTLRDSKGNLYGATAYGGGTSPTGAGVIFQITP